MYKVIKSFTDIQDNGHLYKEGDEYPRAGVKVSANRIASLASDKNRQKTPLISESKSNKDLNPATPAQPEKVEREAPLKKVSKEHVAEVEKPKRNKNKED